MNTKPLGHVYLAAIQALFLFIFTSEVGSADQPKRIALVVGNSAYSSMQLKNPKNDALRVGEALRASGFEVMTVTDSNLKELTKEINSFVSRLEPGDIGLFYYSGHGMQMDGENYMLPIDYAAEDPVDARFSSYSMQQVQAKMENAGLKMTIIIIDACRDNPFRSWRSVSKGLAAMDAGRGSFVAFATGPGQVASDNPGGDNGLFTKYLVQALKAPGLRLDEVFNQVRAKVYTASGGRQLPWTSSSVMGDFFFLSPASTSPVKESIASGVTGAEPSPGSGFSLEDLDRQAEQAGADRQQWARKLVDMKEAFGRVQDFEKRDVTSSLKQQAWQRFLSAFTADDPYSEEDEALVATGRKRLDFWKLQSAEVKRQVDSLREKALSEVDVAVMPIINKLSSFNGLTTVFRKFESGLYYASPKIDITEEVVRELDSGAGPVNLAMPEQCRMAIIDTDVMLEKTELGRSLAQKFSSGGSDWKKDHAKEIDEKLGPAIIKIAEASNLDMVFRKFESGLIFVRDEVDITSYAVGQVNEGRYFGFAGQLGLPIKVGGICLPPFLAIEAAARRHDWKRLVFPADMV